MVPETFISVILLIAAITLFFLAATAMLRLPDVYTQLNLLAKASALGMLALAGSLALQSSDWVFAAKAIGASSFIYLAGRLSRRWLEKMASARGIFPWEL